MPCIDGSRRHARRLLACASAALVAAAINSASASAACDASPTTKPFLPFGDSAPYSLVPNGHFELGTPGWKLGDAAVVDGNESYLVRDPADSHSLLIQDGGRAATAEICVSLDHPTFRFFARRMSGSGDLDVAITWKDGNGETTVSAGSVTGEEYAEWQPSPAVALAAGLPLSRLNQSLQVRLVFEANGGAWAIDDVYVDPYSR